VSAATLLEELRGHGALIWAEGDRLRYSGPERALTPQALTQLAEHKVEIMALLDPADDEASESQQTTGTAEATAVREDHLGETELSRFDQLKLHRASKLGLVAKWSREFGYISVHDPTTGEWHDLQAKDAPGWAKRESHKRKDLWRAGNKRAYWLTATEMEEIWEKEQGEMWSHPAVTDKGMVFEDYLEEERG
jgi:TubC N-terminal docking domain